MIERIAAVIVTFNRKELLLKNLFNCLLQTRPLDKIYVIDNASTDGTFEFLLENGVLKYDNVEYLCLDENQGGAGGFYHGLSIAYNKGFDMFWMMDDDGCPEKDTLEQLLRGLTKDIDVIGPLIYCEEPNLAHSKYLVENRRSDELNIIKSVPYSYPVHPFNGTLLKRRVVDKIGFPIKELFIWGDEQEFRLRWLKEGFREATYTAAAYFHPKNKLQFNKYWIFKTPRIKENRKYLYFRNQAYIFKKYRGFPYFVASISYMFISILFFERHKIKSLHGLIDGLSGNLSDPKIN